MDTVDAWVVGKMERATTDLSDITHYLDGTTEYAKGGMMAKGGNVRSLLKNFNEEKPTVALIIIADDVSNDFMKEKFDKKIKWNELSDGEKQKYNEDYKVNKSKFDTYLMYEFVKMYYSDDKIKQKCKGSGTKTLNAIKSVMIDLAKKYDDSKYEDGGLMADGGRVLVGKFDEQQLRNKEDKKAVEKAQKETGLKYIDSKIVKKGGKMMLEVYLISDEEYHNSSKFADGGMMDKAKYNLSFNYNPSVVKNSEAEKIVSKYTKDWKHDNDFDEVSFFVMGLSMGKAKQLQDELKMEDVYNIEIDKSRYAYGGMMAKGGNVSIKEGDKVIYKGEKRTVYALYPEGMASLCLIDDEDDYEYEDVEEDYQVSIKDLTPVKGSKKKTKGIDLFEDYQDIPLKVQKVLDKYQEDIEDGDYKGLEKALKELEKIGYTFEYGLDGIAYDLRPIGTQGKSQFMEF